MALFAGSSYDLITKYLPDAVDEYFVADSKTVILEHGSKFIDVSFNEAGYVKIADVLLDGLSNYYQTQIENDRFAPNVRPSNPGDFAAYAGNLGSGQRDGFQIGGADVLWEIFRLQWVRGRQFRIDHIANEETGKVLTGGLIEKFHREKVIPEVDACRFSVIADSASATVGNLVTETVSESSGDQYINESNILRKFFKMRKWLVTNGVPLEELVWFVSPNVYEVLVNSDKLTKYITQSDYRSEQGLTIAVQKFNNVPIIEVEPSRFFTHVAVTNNGYQPGVGSKAINYMMCSKKAIVPIRKLEVSKMYGEDQTGLVGFYGTMMNYLLYHGVVIPKNKMIGTYVSIGAEGTAAAASGVLLVDLVAGAQISGSTTFRNYFTQPAALRGTVVYAAGTGNDDDENPFTLGSAVSGIDETDGPVSVKPGDTFSSAETKLYFALVDYRGICIATSSFITLPKKA